MMIIIITMIIIIMMMINNNDNFKNIVSTHQAHIPSDFMLVAQTIITPAVPGYHEDSRGKQKKILPRLREAIVD